MLIFLSFKANRTQTTKKKVWKTFASVLKKCMAKKANENKIELGN